jgi:hypothetical protein
VAGLAIKHPPKKTKKTTCKNPLKIVIFYFLFFFEIIYLQKNSKVPGMHSIKNISERIKIDTQSRADAY